MWFHTISRPTAMSIIFNSFFFIILLFLFAKVRIPFLSTKEIPAGCMNCGNCCMNSFLFRILHLHYFAVC